MKPLALLAVFFPAALMAQNFEGLFKGGELELPLLSAGPDQAAKLREVSRFPLLPLFAGFSLDAPEKKVAVFHLRVVEPKERRIMKMIIGPPRPGPDYKLRVKPAPVEQS